LPVSFSSLGRGGASLVFTFLIKRGRSQGKLTVCYGTLMNMLHLSMLYLLNLLNLLCIYIYIYIYILFNSYVRVWNYICFPVPFVFDLLWSAVLSVFPQFAAFWNWKLLFQRYCNILEFEPLIFYGICNILVLKLFMLDGVLRREFI
jgi:hypothetical protein